MKTASLKQAFSFEGKTAMVTGGCQNFGLEISDGFAEMGAAVIVTSRKRDKAEARAEDIRREFGVEALGLEMNINSEESVARAFAAAKGRFGTVDALVSNAGGHGGGVTTGDLPDEPLATWEGYLRDNLTGAFLVLREYARLMIPHRRGAVVVISSVSSLLGRDRSVYDGQDMIPVAVPYTASKAGAIGLVYDCAALLGRHNIRVNAISPGGFERRQPQPFIDAYSSRTPLGRMGRDGHDLKGAAVFLCSDAAAYITGHNLYVDGGFSRFK